MTNNGNVMDCAIALYHFHEAIIDLESCDLERSDLREVEKGMTRLFNLLNKYRNRTQT